MEKLQPYDWTRNKTIDKIRLLINRTSFGRNDPA